MLAQKGHLPDILCHQMPSNPSTCFRKSAPRAPIMQPVIGTATRLGDAFYLKRAWIASKPRLPLEAPENRRRQSRRSNVAPPRRTRPSRSPSLGPVPAIRYQFKGCRTAGMTMTETDHFSLLRQGKAAWSAWREANPSIQPDLREANLTGANLAGVLLGRADLGKANLSRANLTGAILGGSDFSGADLSGANLSRANLGRAMLREANLSRANLSEANLGAADLRRANLSLANFTGATLSDADL